MEHHQGRICKEKGRQWRSISSQSGKSKDVSKRGKAQREGRDALWVMARKTTAFGWKVSNNGEQTYAVCLRHTERQTLTVSDRQMSHWDGRDRQADYCIRFASQLLTPGERPQDGMRRVHRSGRSGAFGPKALAQITLLETFRMSHSRWTDTFRQVKFFK